MNITANKQITLAILLALIAIPHSYAQTNEAFEAYRRNHQEKVKAMNEEFNANRKSQIDEYNAFKKNQRDKFNEFVKKRWQKFKSIPEADLPESPDALEIKVVDIPAIKEDDNPNIEIIDALLKEGISAERSAQIALEIIDSLGIEAIRKGQSIGIATEPKNEAKPAVVSYNIDDAETVSLLQSKSGGYKYVESDEKISNRKKQFSINPQYFFPLSFRRVTSAFGMRVHPVFKMPRRHDGVDYSASIGTPVHSVADGVVEKSYHEKGGGNIVAVRHENGMLSYYMHLSEISVAKGSKVAAGQAIGKAGNTGASTGPHLHLGIKANGIWQNPEKVLGIK